MSDPIEAVRNYVKQRTGRRGLDPDSIASLDIGCDTEAELRLSDLNELLATIDRLNAQIDKMHAERMAFAEQMNAELDKLRDAVVRRDLEKFCS